MMISLLTFRKWIIFLVAFDIICYYIAQCSTLSLEELNTFKLVKSWLCEAYRKHRYLRKHITPKFHLLESHIEYYLEEYGCLGLFTEETIEHFHHIKNDLNNLFKNKRDFLQRETILFRRFSIRNEPQIRIQKTIMEEKRRKRKDDNSEDSANKKLKQGEKFVESIKNNSRVK